MDGKMPTNVRACGTPGRFTASARWPRALQRAITQPARLARLARERDGRRRQPRADPHALESSQLRCQMCWTQGADPAPVGATLP